MKKNHVKEQLHRKKMNACQQPYYSKCTSFREITEVKQLFSTRMGDHISNKYVLSMCYWHSDMAVLHSERFSKCNCVARIEMCLGMFKLLTPGFWMGVIPSLKASK
jgi:hypothetical protein